MTDLPSGTVTLLFTDMEGSTRLVTRLGDRYADLLAQHHAVLRAAFLAHGGVEIGTEGDAFFVAFNGATEAVRAAVHAQRALATQAWPDGATVRVRMGLHTGEPAVSLGTYVGYDVHMAARICASAHGGQIVTSEATRRLVPAELAEVGFRDLGEHRLKDLLGPERLHQILAADLPSEFAPLRSLDAAHTNLPNPVTSFVGRERDLQRVRDGVSHHRLVTLTGSGGSGKTRLALRAAGDLLADFPDGVWLVRLGAVRDPTLVGSTVAASMGLVDVVDMPPVEAIAEHSRGRRLLLVLDNFEHLMAATGVVVELLESSPGIHLLVTSREVLNVRGEWEVAVPPLDLPQRDRRLGAAALREVESVRLFVERARAVLPDFDVTDDNTDALVEIAHRLEGLPLAIELAAARVKVLTPPVLAERLRNRLGILTGGSRDLPERQRTLRATIEWSYGLLTEEERRLLGRLAVFNGPVQLETVEAVCGDDGDVLEVLSALLDKSLVRRATSLAGEGRFWMLESIKQFVREVTADDPDTERSRHRHAEYYRELAERAGGEFFGPRQLDWLERIDSDRDNVYAAISWCLERGHVDRAAEITLGVYPFWWLRAHFTTGRRWLRQVLGAGVGSPVVRAGLLVASARLAAEQADFARAEDDLAEAERLGRGHDAPVVVAQALSDRIALQARRGQAVDEDAADEALHIYRGMQNLSGEGELLIRLAYGATMRGDHREAARLFDEAVSLMRAAGNAWGTGAALNNRGFVAALEERFEDALPDLEESKKLLEMLDTKEGLATVTDTLALVVAAQGDTTTAVELYEQSLQLFRDMSYAPGVASELVHLGRTRAVRGEYELARDCLAEALELVPRVDDAEVVAFAAEAAAALALRTDRPHDAARLLAAAGVFRERNDVPLAPVDRRRLERDVATVRALLAPDDVAHTCDGGGTVGAEQMLDDALSVVRATVSG